jgi:hypothetical protein
MRDIDPGAARLSDHAARRHGGTGFAIAPPGNGIMIMA